MALLRFVFLIISALATAKVNAADSLHTHKLPGHSISLRYENDVFLQTDRYYTQGIKIELISPALGNLFINRFLHNSYTTRRYALVVEHRVYTPTSIVADSLLYRDRPYAATLSASYSISASSGPRMVTTGITAGIIGPAAGGKWMQTTIHRNTGSAIPRGWQYQLRNDLLINWNGSISRFVTLHRLLGARLEATAQVGTYRTNCSLAAAIFLGHHRHMPGKKMQLFAFVVPSVSAIGYDATLQGGLLNRSSPYALHGKDINRLTFAASAGITLRCYRLQLTPAWSFLSPEFVSAKSHRWGGITATWLW